MDIGMDDVVVFVYTLAVMLTGLFIGTPGQPEIDPITGAAGIVVAALWTGYFSWRVAPRVFEWERGDEEEEDETDDETDPGERENDDEISPWSG